MNRAIVFKGNAHIRRFVAGVLSPNIIGPIGGTKFTIKANSEIKKRFGKGLANHGKLTGSTATSQPSEISLGFNEVDPELLAIFMLGTTAPLNITGGTVTGESITLIQDQWVKTAQRNISVSAIATLTLGVDFEENKRIGAIKALTLGAVGVQSLGYTHGAVTANRVLAGVNSQIDVELIFDGENLEDGSKVYIRVPKVTLTPSSEIDLLSDDYVDAEFSGEAIKLTTEPAEIIFDEDATYA